MLAGRAARAGWAWRWLPPETTPDAAVLLTARGVRAFGDGFVSVLLPVYLLSLGLGGLEIGGLSTATLVGSAALTLVVGLVAHRFKIRPLLLAHPKAWRGMLLGATSVSSARCFLCIPFFAAIPLAVLIWALRTGAPTRLERCGAIAGIVAGAVGAAAYAFNCSSDSVPFVAFWYGAAIALCAFIGAQLGPRLLRW